MNIKEVQSRIYEWKKHGRVNTNIIPGAVPDDVDFAGFETDKTVVFWLTERFRVRGFYATLDDADAVELLRKVPKGTIVEQLYRKENENVNKRIPIEAGFEQIATFIRISDFYVSNPYENEEVTKRAILAEMYDPTMGRMAEEKDIDKLFDMTKAVFDIRTDAVFTMEEWKRIVDAKRCIVSEEDGEIIAYLVFEREGTKMYAHSVVNLGPANYLYNIERKVFTKAWEEGVREIYGWYNINNKKSILRRKEDGDRSIGHTSYLYNDIFEKKED